MISVGENAVSDIVERCVNTVTLRPYYFRDQIVRAVLAEYARAAQEPEMVEKIAALLDWADDERVRAAMREDVERVLPALFRATGV